MCGAFQTDRDVTEFGNHFEVSPGPAAKIKYCETRPTLDVLQHRRDVLADIVIACACPELFGALVIMFQYVPVCSSVRWTIVFRSRETISYSFSSQRLRNLLRQKNCKVVPSPSLQIANRMLSEDRVSLNESQCDSTRMPCAPENIWFRPL